MQCLDHKTGYKGPAQLVLKKSTDQLLDKYYHLVTTKITPQKGNENHLLMVLCIHKFTEK